MILGVPLATPFSSRQMPSPAGTAYAPFQAAGYFVCPDAAQLAWARLWQSEMESPAYLAGLGAARWVRRL